MMLLVIVQHDDIVLDTTHVDRFCTAASCLLLLSLRFLICFSHA